MPCARFWDCLIGPALPRPRHPGGKERRSRPRRCKHGRTRSPRAPQPPCKRWLRQTPVLSRIGWRRLAKKHRGRSALSDDLGNLPHEAACHLDYVRQLGAPVHCSALPKSPDDVQSFVDQGPHQSGMVLVRYHSEAVKSSEVLT